MKTLKGIKTLKRDLLKKLTNSRISNFLFGRIIQTNVQKLMTLAHMPNLMNLKAAVS